MSCWESLDLSIHMDVVQTHTTYLNIATVPMVTGQTPKQLKTTQEKLEQHNKYSEASTWSSICRILLNKPNS